MKNGRYSILIGFFLLLTTSLWGQFTDKAFVHITSKHGLMSDEVRSLLQDESGFIWIGTSTGLSKFDGHRFTNYFGNDFDTLDRSSVWVNFIYEIKGNQIFGQGSVFIPQLGIFRKTTGADYSKRNDISTIAPEIGAAYQLRTLNQPGPFDFSRTEFPYSGIPGNKESTWLYTPQGILRWQSANNRIDTFQLNPELTQPLEQLILLLEDKEGCLWVQTHAGISRFNPRTKKHTLIYRNVFLARPFTEVNGEENFNHFGPAARRKILCDRDGKIWICHEGIKIYDPSRQQKEAYQHNPHSLTSLSSNATSCIIEDNQGRIWIGTTGNGINIWDPYRPNAENFQEVPEAPNSLAANYIQSVEEIPGKGLLLGAINHPVQFFSYANRTFQAIPTPDMSNRSATDIVYWMDETSTGQIGLKNSQLTNYLFDTSKMVFYPYRARHGQQLLPFYVNQFPLVSSNEDHYYHAFVNGWYVGKDIPDSLAFGLYRYDSARDSLFNYPKNFEDPTGTGGPISGLPYNLFEYSADSTIWMSGRGVSRFYPQKEVFRNYYYDATNPDGFGIKGGFHTFFEDSNQNLWIGSFLSGGAYKIKKEHLLSDSIVFAHYRMDNSDLPSNSILGFLEDSRGFIWITTQRGICKYDPEEDNFVEIPVTNEKRISYNYGPEKLQSGRFVFTTLDGLFTFHPDSIRTNTTPPRVHITDLTINNQPVPLRGMPGDTLDWETPLDSTVLFTEAIDLAYAQNDFALSFVALNYTYPERTRYKYKLEGYDDDWIETTPEDAKATYTNIPHGDYTFRVIACNSDGVWNEEGDTMQISISAPWWLTPWAYLGYLLLLGGLIAGIVRWRTYALQRQREELRARVNEQTQELKESNEQLRVAKEEALAAEASAKEANQAKSTFLSFVSHELRTPLTSIIGFANLNKRRLEEKLFPLIPKTDQKVERTMQQVSQNEAVIIQEGQRLADLINDLLDLAKIESGKVEWHMAEIAPQNLISRTVSATEGLFTEKPDLTLVTQVDPDLPTITGDFDRLLQVLLNLVSNAVKFTDSGEVTLKAQLSPAGGGARRAGVESSSAPSEGGEQGLLFFVKDTGAGIPREYQTKIFERFQQVDGQQEGKPKGTGLGLPICKEIVEHHGGSIWVESAVGVGSTFYFTVPINNQAVPAQKNA